jgi:hypothetical protein
MPKRPKRVLSEDYRDGSKIAVEFLREMKQRNCDPWLIAEQFEWQRKVMVQDSSVGFRDAVFLYIQFGLQETWPSLEDDAWLAELEDPDAWMEEESE